MASELTVANIKAERGVGDPPTVQMLNNHGADSLGGEQAGKLQFISKPAGSAVTTAEIVGTSIDATGVTGKLDFYTATGGTSTKRLTIDSAGGIVCSSMPTSDPSVAGQLWNDSGTVKISAG